MNFFESPEWFCIIWLGIFALFLFGGSAIISLYIRLKEKNKKEDLK